MKASSRYNTHLDASPISSNSIENLSKVENTKKSDLDTLQFYQVWPLTTSRLFTMEEGNNGLFITLSLFLFVGLTTLRTFDWLIH